MFAECTHSLHLRQHRWLLARPFYASACSNIEHQTRLYSCALKQACRTVNKAKNRKRVRNENKHRMISSACGHKRSLWLKIVEKQTMTRNNCYMCINTYITITQHQHTTDKQTHETHESSNHNMGHLRDAYAQTLLTRLIAIKRSSWRLNPLMSLDWRWCRHVLTSLQELLQSTRTVEPVEKP